MFDFDNLFDFDNMSPKKRRIVVRIIIVVSCVLTTLGGILFSVLTM